MEGSHIIILKRCCISFVEDCFVLANNADDDEMLHYHLGVHSLLKFPFRGFWYKKGQGAIYITLKMNLCSYI